jgi:predicted CoA-binding protein
MVQVFRSSEAVYAIAEEAIEIGAKVLWMQIGVRNDEAARLAESAGLKVVMNRCPKIELFRPFWKPRLNQAI